MNSREAVDSPVVRAAGGVVWRPGPGGDVEVLLVHRPRYDDWSFPKGKCDGGEADEQCARREVAEETGLDCPLGPELTAIRYVDNRGRDKVVRYWSMAAGPGAFTPNHEVDEVRWLAVDEAAEALTYDHDVGVLEAFVAQRERARTGP